MIACLGWGSLIWCQKSLPIAGTWRTDGPQLPVEFARESRDQRITLVICEDAPAVTVLWATLDVHDLEEAKQVLAVREGVGQQNILNSIGCWSSASHSTHHCSEAVGRWALERGLDGVVWTALKPKIADDYRTPGLDEVIEHLASLGAHSREVAEEYVRLAPRQIITPYRRAIEDAFGWTPLGIL